MPTPTSLPEPAKHPARIKRPWRQYRLPAALRVPFHVDNRKPVGRALLAFRKGIVEQLGGDDRLTASQLERLDAVCAVKVRLLAADLGTEALTPQQYAVLVRELDRLLGSLERSATPERRHERQPEPERPDLAALLAADDE